ncbi:MAG: putative sulfate exporter family transporter [Elusimicrobia bacterium HGW-Elusimicrobia-3]|nr:MAG: putative sulfate exporter family transporter [Elusimicrobia bacterium HGW-Elusimicrobia-3]
MNNLVSPHAVSYGRRALFAGLFVFCLTPYASPPLALALGLALALTAGHPFGRYNGRAVKYLLQASVVGLGFGMNFRAVLAAGSAGAGYTAFTIAATLAAGLLAGRLLGVGRKTSALISAGTAVCGGSAIAALAPVLDADEHEISVALGTVFILNAAALFLFPPLGHAAGLTQGQFGLWAAIAIHDTSSVVGAAARYGGEALELATTVKLARALWIVPLALGAALLAGKKNAKISVPYFIFAFLLASALATALPARGGLFSALSSAARQGLTLTLFLIGAGLSREAVRQVGLRPVLQGAALWFVVGAGSLLAIKNLF